MFKFKLTNNELLDHIEIDGYQIAGIALEGININIKIDENKKIISYFNETDIKLIESINYQAILLEATSLATDYIYNKDYSLFKLEHHVTDILNEQKDSFFSPPHNKTSPEKFNTLQIKRIESEEILNNVKPTKIDYNF